MSMIYVQSLLVNRGHGLQKRFEAFLPEKIKEQIIK